MSDFEDRADYERERREHDICWDILHDPQYDNWEDHKDDYEEVEDVE